MLHLNKSFFIVGILVILVACASRMSRSEVNTTDKPVPLPANPQFPGDAEKGYEYLVTGDYLKSGIPAKLYKQTLKMTPKKPDLNRQGVNNGIPYDFTFI